MLLCGSHLCSKHLLVAGTSCARCQELSKNTLATLSQLSFRQFSNPCMLGVFLTPGCEVQGQALGQRPSHQGRYTTNSGGVKSGGSSPFHSPGLPSQSSHASQPQSGFQHHKNLPNGNRGPQQGGLTEGDLADLQVALQFPQAQRLFIMFLQAADSHRLNSSLIRQVHCTFMSPCTTGFAVHLPGITDRITIHTP